MKNLLFNSVAGRSILVLLVGLSISHVASLLVYTAERGEALNLLYDRLVAERMALITRIIEETPQTERQKLLAVLDSPGLRVAEGLQEPVTGDVRELQRPHILGHILRLYLGNPDDDSVRVSFAAAREDGRPDSLFGPENAALEEHAEDVRRYIEGHMAETTVAGTFLASIRLADSSWLYFSSPLSIPKPFSYRMVLSMAIMFLAVVAFAIWAVRRWTAPLATFAHAAERLGVDVTAPPLAESGLLEVRKAAHSMNQMQERIRRFVEDRTEMIAAIAHDLGTPITRLRLRAEYIEDEEQHQKMLADLNEMEEMIAATLAFAREEGATEPREVFDLNSLLQSICDDFSDAGHTIEFRPEGRLPYAFRLVALRRAFTNLLGNALSYGKKACVTIEERSDAIVVRIDDEGPGIPEKLREEVFKPFMRLEASRSRETGGTGLGLTVARTVIRGHGGDIVLRNRTEGGLRVEVTLPR
jgi:signal transduction histidine kinase